LQMYNCACKREFGAQFNCVTINPANYIREKYFIALYHIFRDYGDIQ